MNTNHTTTNKKQSIETILLLLLFVFGMLGFIYAFGNKDKAKTEKVVIIEETVQSNGFNNKD